MKRKQRKELYQYAHGALTDHFEEYKIQYGFTMFGLHFFRALSGALRQRRQKTLTQCWTFGMRNNDVHTSSRSLQGGNNP
jgi:hypothetical protein